MTLDHALDDGYIERKDFGYYTYVLYAKLVRGGKRDPRYQLLCYNCNLSKAHYSRCPHKDKRLARAGRRAA